MAVMKGLALYEQIKTVFLLIIIYILLSCSIYFLQSAFSKNYQEIQGNITTNVDNQSVTYTVNGKQYTQNVPFDTKTTKPIYQNGAYVVYYAQNNPNDYSLGSNPLTISEIATAVFCCLAISIGLWLWFLTTHPELAGVVGGINAASSVAGVFNRS